MDGVLIINKPKGMTSTRVVEKVRRKLKTKVGHTGTLDPIATGVLILLTGRATRFSWLFLGMEKSYRVVGYLGIVTDTYDTEGRVLEERDVNTTCGELKGVLKEFVGEIEQIPPPFSAKKVEGKRAYKLARKGTLPKLKPVKVNIYKLKLLRCDIPEFEVYVKVSSGTYIRSLIHDIGSRLSTGAVVKDLVREEVGSFSLSDAVDLDSFLRAENPWDLVIPIEEALSFLPKVSLDYFLGKRIINGNPVLMREEREDGYVRIYIDETFIGIGKVRSGVLKPERLLLPGSIQT